jgi:hypothetical protein
MSWLGTCTEYDELRPVNGILALPLDNWISNDNTYIHTHNKEPAQIRFTKKPPHTITKMNGSINMNNTIPGSMNAVYVLFD